MLRSLQVLRAVAALMVVLFHLRGVELKYGQGSALLDVPARYGDAGVDLFFVVSGFVMAMICDSRPSGPGEAASFLARRAWRVLPPYWIYTTIVVALMMWFPGQVNTSYADQSVFASYLLWPQQQLPVLTVGWTLIHEAHFYLVMAAAIACVPKRLFMHFLLAWSFIVIACCALLPTPANPALRLVVNPLTLEFVAGAVVGLTWRRLPSDVAYPSMLAGVGMLVTAMVMMPAEGPASLSPVSRVCVFGTASLLILAGAVLSERRSETAWAPRRLLTRIGNSSYSLYLSHIFVISAFGRLWQLSGLNQTPLQHLAFIATSLLACVLVGCVSYRWLEQPLLSLGSRRSGPRRATGRTASEAVYGWYTPPKSGGT